MKSSRTVIENLQLGTKQKDAQAMNTRAKTKVVRQADPTTAKSRVVQVSHGTAGSPSPKHRGLQVSASLLSIRHPKDLILWAIAACRAGAERIHIDVNDGNEELSGIAETRDIKNTEQMFSPRHLRSIKEAIHKAGFGVLVDVH